MSFQLSVAARDGELNAIPAAIGASAILEFYSGSAPANCAASPTGTLLASLSLPSTYFAGASSGSMARTGTWSGTVGTGGTAGYFRLYDSGPTICHAQGTVTITGGGGDLTLDNNVLGAGQTITISTFTLTAGNA